MKSLPEAVGYILAFILLLIGSMFKDERREEVAGPAAQYTVSIDFPYAKPDQLYFGADRIDLGEVYETPVLLSSLTLNTGRKNLVDSLMINIPYTELQEVEEQYEFKVLVITDTLRYEMDAL